MSPHSRSGELHEPPHEPFSHRILVVDDEPSIVESLQQALRLRNYTIITAPSAVEAVPSLEREPFAVIICDQRMPQMSGLEFLARAKELQPNASRVLMTGVLDLNTLVDAINRGEIYRFILKPWITEELLATVSNGVNRYELVQRNADLHDQRAEMNQRLTELNRTLEEQIEREATQNARLANLNATLQQNFDRSIELCLSVMQTYHPALGTNARRVHELCRHLADALEMPPEQRSVFEVSAWLHDIGLVGVPRRMLKLLEKSPGLLKPDERTLIERHPIVGQEVTGFLHELGDVGPIIRAHHERFDGTGYPDGFRGDGIPWLARLLAVAIEYARHDNPHRALVAIREQSGASFDPEAVQIFERHRPANFAARKERQVLFSELEPGMVLAKGIYSANGLLLLPEGQELNPVAIEKLQNHNAVDRINQQLVVYC